VCITAGKDACMLGAVVLGVCLKEREKGGQVCFRLDQGLVAEGERI